MDSSLRHYRVFRFGRFEFNEGTHELLANGSARALEAKPRALLQALLAQPKMVVSKHDLKQAAWPDKQFVEEGSLATAVYSLRNSLDDRDHQIISVTPGVGYRLSLAVAFDLVERPAHEPFRLTAGDRVPGRPRWCLEAPLGLPSSTNVWLARHDSTGDTRVFKFAETAERLDALKREVEISRILRTQLGERDDIVEVMEWNFETRPYFTEARHGGPDLGTWLATAGAAAASNLEMRLAVVAQVARTVADAHRAGVLHGDIRPGNILIAHQPPEEAPKGKAPVTRLLDFGGAALTDAARVEALTLSLEALAGRGVIAQLAADARLYRAPELQAGGLPTGSGDIYALGVLLYQMVVGVIDQPLAAGWEENVPDALLRADIAAAAAGDVARRLPSAMVLADRLETLAARRTALARERAAAARLATLAEADRRARLRRPWIVLASAAVGLGLIGTAIAARQAFKQRDEALRQARISASVNLFLTDDLLGRGNPVNSGKENETLMEAVANAEPRIAYRLSTEPQVAASIYSSLAQAYGSRGSYDKARHAYTQAAAAFEQAQGPDSPDATIAMLHQAQTEAMAAQAGSVDNARALIAAAAPRIDRAEARSAELRVWQLAADATLQLVGGSMTMSRQEFTKAADLADSMPDAFDLGSRLVLRQREAFAAFRLGRWDEADTLLAELQQRQTALHGPLHPDTLLVRLNRAQVLMGRGAASAAVATLNEAFLDQLIKVFGAEHHVVLTARAARARAQMQLEHYDDALRDNREVYRAAVARQGEASQFAILALTDIARAQCRSAEIDDGIKDAEKAYQAALGAFAANPIVAQDVSLDLAACLIAGRRYPDARQLLDKIDRKGVAEFEADPDVDAIVDLMLADIAVASGDRKQAAALMRQHPTDAGVAAADPYTQRWAKRIRDEAAE